MSCLIANLQGGNPEIFPINALDMRRLQEGGMNEMAKHVRPDVTAPSNHQHVGAALRPDRSPFYLTTLAPELAPSLTHRWLGGFFAPFGVGDIVGSVQGDPTGPLTSIVVKAQLSIDGKEHVRVEWEVVGSQITTPNKSALIKTVSIPNPGPHDPNDIRRCIALHAPQRVFGEPRAIIAMQCGVAAACLIEAIC
jgi:hypothetical protein